jgi:hypothetical protein
MLTRLKCLKTISFNSFVRKGLGRREGEEAQGQKALNFRAPALALA